MTNLQRHFTEASRANAYLFLVIANACWAGNFVVGRAIAGHVPPVTLAFLRWTGASLLILAFAAGHLKREQTAIRAHWPMLVLLGVLGSGSFNTLQYLALTGTTATNAALINAAGPAMIAIAVVTINGERLRPVQMAGLIIALLGVLTVLTKGHPERLAQLVINRGDAVMLAAMAVWAVYTALLRQKPAISALSFAAVTYIVAALINAPLAAAELALGAHVQVTTNTVLAVLYTAVFPSFLAYLCFNRGVEIIGGTRAGAFLYLIPLIAGVLAFMVLGEQPEPYHAAGFAAIAAGVLLTSR